MVYLIRGLYLCTSNVPTLFIYHQGELQNQLLTLRSLGGVDMKVEGAFYVLGMNECGVAI